MRLSNCFLKSNSAPSDLITFSQVFFSLIHTEKGNTVYEFVILNAEFELVYSRRKRRSLIT